MESTAVKYLILLGAVLALAKLTESCGYTYNIVSNINTPFYAEVLSPATKQEFDWFYFKKKNTRASVKIYAPHTKCGEKKTTVRIYVLKDDKYKLVGQKSAYLTGNNGTITAHVTGKIGNKFQVELVERRNVMRSDFKIMGF